MPLSGWAYHYHLAVETPRANLVAGMQWLHRPSRNRFNKLRGEHGHLFQGRYKAPLVEDGEALGLLCHYIHLNPVRAGLLPIERLSAYQQSSYRYLLLPIERPDFLAVTTALAEAGGLTDAPAGRRVYADYLRWQATEGPAGKSKAYVSLSKGWALGTKEFKQALLRDHAAAPNARAWESLGVCEVRESQLQRLLDRLLAHIAPKARQDSRKTAAWKVHVAQEMKDHSDAGNAWLADKLGMGSATTSASMSASPGKR